MISTYDVRKWVNENEKSPYYEKEGKSISFSACKNHISLYAGVEAIEYFTLELKGFVTKKNAIYFPYEKALPIELIEKIAK